MKLLTALYLLCCSLACFAQLEGPAWLGQQYVASASSTFDPSTVFQAYWKPSAATYTTNAGTTTLNDLGAGGYHLTNTTAANLPTRVEAGFDGQDYLNFDGDTDYLRQIALTNSQPDELWAVLAFTGVESGANVLFDSSFAVDVQSVLQNSTSWQMAAGSTVSLSASVSSVTNRWLLHRWRFDGASSFAQTNSVSILSGNANTKPRDGLNVGCAYGLNFQGPMQLAWLGVVNSNLTAGTSSSNLAYLYFKSNWPSLNLP